MRIIMNSGLTSPFSDIHRRSFTESGNKTRLLEQDPHNVLLLESF